jgi:penicillin amidase
MRLGIVAVLFTGIAHASDMPSVYGYEPTSSLPGLQSRTTVLRDKDGVPHIYAARLHDAVFMQGWLHANDRLFQIDNFRRTASGSLAELLGASQLAQDVQLRTLGLRRGAEASYAALSPDVRAAMQSYADGVNAWVASHALPAEYAALQLSRFEPWTPLDSVAVGKLFAFQLSFDLDTDLTLDYLTYQQTLIAKYGPAGAQVADALFFGDLNRSAPFADATTVPDSNGAPPRPAQGWRGKSELPMSAPGMQLLHKLREAMRQMPIMERTLSRKEHQIGSNEWAVSGRYTRDGRALIANDPHLSLGLPSNFYDVQLTTLEGLSVIGSSIPGVPMVLLGQNRHIAWGLTTTGYDVTDTYQEQIVPDASSPSGLATVYRGLREAVIPIPVTFKVNLRIAGAMDQVVPVPATGGIPPVVLIVPRHGPIVQLDAANGMAISVQWTGAGASRELESVYRLNHASNLNQFKAALQYFDVGSQNFVYGDIQGNIAYFSTGEVPLREDLQAGTVNGAPPWLIRNGQGGNEWLRKSSPGPTDGTGFEALPFAELPQVVNPSAGFFANANNDPAGVTLNNNPVDQLRPSGVGLYFLSAGFDYGLRAARITELLRQKLARGRVDRDDMADIQADVALYDASVLSPAIVRAFDAARAAGAPTALAQLAADPRVAEAVARLRRWDFSTPTGLDNGYDAADRNGQTRRAGPREIDASVAATIYSVWRGQAIRLGVDSTLTALGLPTPGGQAALKALRHLVERNGVGLSGVDFFAAIPLPDAAQRRDAMLLQSLKNSLDLLAGPAFSRAFAGSTNQNDYRWGKLHRITFRAVFPDASIPGAATPAFPPSVAGLPGLAVDGGLATVDVAGHNVRAADDGGFTFGSGANRRYVGAMGWWPGGIDARSILPGGISGVPGDKFYANMLGRWLTNETYPFRTNLFEVLWATDSKMNFKPAR